jgi:hypothetical protein
MKSWSVGVMVAILMLVMSDATWGTPQYFPGTGHYYDVIADLTGLSWSEARADAEGQIWQGVHGYLACITSAEENQFVFNLSLNSGTWYPSSIWYVGPWLGGFQAAGSDEPDGGWTWVSGEPWNYSNWLSGQPDNNGYQGQNENSLVFWGREEITPTWNDYTESPPDLPGGGQVHGYVVEFDVPTTIGACCFMHICVLLTQPDCTDNGGTFLGEGTTCEANPCEGQTPTRETTWGSVKSAFRR